MTRRLLFQGLQHRGVGEVATPFPRLLYFTLDPYLIELSAKQCGIKYHFWVFGMTRPKIEPLSPRLLANTLLIRPMTQLTNICLCTNNQLQAKWKYGGLKSNAIKIIQYILSSTDRLFRYITTLSWGSPCEMFQARNETPPTLRQPDILPQIIVILSLSDEIFYVCFYTYAYRLPECSVHKTSFAFTCMWQLAISHSSDQPTWGSKYIYIYIVSIITLWVRN